MTAPWPEPSEQVAALFRRCAELALSQTQMIEEVNAATLGGPGMATVSADPVLAASITRSNLANLLHWITNNVRSPGRRVPPNVGIEVLEVSRDIARRGLDSTALDTYRTGQTVAWRLWMEICFAETRDPDLLRELLTISSLSISTFIDDTIKAVGEQIGVEIHQLTRGSNAEKLAAVSLIVEGAPIARAQAEVQLGHPLTGPHVAAIVWAAPGSKAEHLEAVADAFTHSCGAVRRLTVVASATTLWIWVPSARVPDTDELSGQMTTHPDVNIAIGRGGHDLDGFRRSYLDASKTQQMMARLRSVQRVVQFDDVALVALLTHDQAGADEFVVDTLGDFLTADEETQHTVVAYIREQCNTSRTAERLYTHRNTIIRRLARADELLPRPLADNLVGVAAALDIVHWRGRPA
ncbi:PucR family transcriptional regulator [Smaragdicoccus niigatensis]|uniref:PucR family transcriptional regulator n=1 Tax=Smaragdicoccus niigatensis TaxID=359359 RepID=UPI0003666B45|nr:helix-turn-helix domain-containing protein [Smaragdicoccus niigatensis]